MPWQQPDKINLIGVVFDLIAALAAALIAVIALIRSDKAVFHPLYYGSLGRETPRVCRADDGHLQIDYNIAEAYVVQNDGSVGFALLTYFPQSLWSVNTGDDSIRIFSKFESFRSLENFLSWCESEGTHCNPFTDTSVFLFVQENINIPAGEVRYLAIQRHVGFTVAEGMSLPGAVAIIEAHEFHDQIEFRLSRGLTRILDVDLQNLEFEAEDVSGVLEDQAEPCGF